MKLRLYISISVLFAVISVFGQFDTARIDGVIASNEYGDHDIGKNRDTCSKGGTIGLTEWYCTWNADSLFFGVSGNLDATSGRDAMNIYLDFDAISPVNSGNGTDTGYNFDNFSPILPFNSDILIISENGLDCIYEFSGGSWQRTSANLTAFTNNNSSNGVLEVGVRWSDITTAIPTKFNWLGFLSYGTGGGGFFRPIPQNNEYCNPCSNPNFVRYFTIDTTTNNTSVKPFSQESYTHVGSNVSGFNDIAVFDFTMNTTSASITRGSGGWDINNDLVVGTGDIDFGSTASDCEVAGDVIVKSTGTLDLGTSTGNNKIAGSMEIESGGTLIGSTNTSSAIVFQGDFQNNGTLTANSSNFKFNGSSIAQTISGDIDGANAFSRLEIDNTNGLINNTSSDTLVVADSLLLTDGVIQNSKIIKLRNNGVIKPIGGKNTSYVEGRFAWAGYDTDSLVFPIGDSIVHAPLSVHPNATDSRGTQSRTYQAEYFFKPYTDVVNFKNQTPSLHHVSYVEYWDLQELSSAGASDREAKIAVYWNSRSDVDGLTAARDSLLVCHYDTASNEWEWISDTCDIYNGGTSEGWVKTQITTSAFSPFTLGSYSSSNPLPVDLLDFSANLSDDGRSIDVSWSTVSELNCNRFDLLKQSDDNFIYSVECSDYSNELREYVFNDLNLSETNTYWLKQYDLDGSETLYGPVIVSLQQKTQLHPNPTTGIVYLSGADQYKSIRITDNLGKEVFYSKRPITQMDLSALGNGLYFVLVEAKNGILTKLPLSIAR